VSSAKHKGKRGGHRTSAHIHTPERHELIYVDYGKIYLNVGGNDITLCPGDCVFIRGGVTHSFYGEPGLPYDFLNIMFYGSPPEELFSRKITVGRKEHAIMETLKREALGKGPFSADMIICGMTEFIIRLHRQISCPSQFLPEPEGLPPYQSEIVRRVVSLIRNEFAGPLSLGKISKAVGVSESYLCALLKKELSETFSSILQKQRVAAAKHLLRESSNTLREVASMSGFNSMPFFFKVFKRVTGMTPREYAASLGDPSERQ
jgi:AraC-like DNA-binding protein